MRSRQSGFTWLHGDHRRAWVSVTSKWNAQHRTRSITLVASIQGNNHYRVPFSAGIRTPDVSATRRACLVKAHGQNPPPRQPCAWNSLMTIRQTILRERETQSILRLLWPTADDFHCGAAVRQLHRQPQPNSRLRLSRLGSLRTDSFLPQQLWRAWIALPYP